jgi:hypothetical protein
MKTSTKNSTYAEDSKAINHSNNSIKQLLKIDDQRPEAMQHNSITESIASSAVHVAQQKTIQRIVGSTAQKVSPEEEMLQGKFESTHQLMGEEEELLQGKFTETHQLVVAEEEELLQGKFTSSTNQMVENSPIQKKENNTGLPDNLKSGVESLSGMSMDHVKVHYGSDKPAQLNALAYAQGSDIHLGSGQEQHLPHEAWHVVQQMQGRVQPTVEIGGVSVNDDVSLETEADVMGAKANSI